MAADRRAARLVEALRSDVAAIVTEARKRSPSARSLGERGTLRLKVIPTTSYEAATQALRASDMVSTVLGVCADVKQPKLVHIAVGALHRLLENGCCDPLEYANVLSTLEALVAAGLEEIRVLQCLTAMCSSADPLTGSSLAKAIVMCFRLHFSRDLSVSGIAAATLRQIVTATLDRVDVTKADVKKSEGFLLFQDLCLVTNGEAPLWLTGLTEMTRTFGLELVETALTSSSALFAQSDAFIGLLREQVCSLVIKLMSPSLKHAGKAPPLLFSVYVRLQRIILALAQRYMNLLHTECEIFLNMITKFLEPDKPLWQRVVALEVCHTLCRQPRLLRKLAIKDDKVDMTSTVFHDLILNVSALAKSLPSSLQPPSGAQSTLTNLGGMSDADSLSFEPAPARAVFLDMLERAEPPQVPVEQATMLAYSCLIDTVKSMSSLVKPPGSTTSLSSSAAMSQSQSNLERWQRRSASDVDALGDSPVPGSPTTPVSVHDSDTSLGLYEELTVSAVKFMASCASPPLVSALTELYRISSTDAGVEAALRALQSLIRIYGTLNMEEERDTVVKFICSSCVPPQVFSVTESLQYHISNKQLHAAYVMLNSAMCLADLLGPTWLPLLASIQQLSAVIDLSSPHDAARAQGHIASIAHTASATTSSATSASGTTTPRHRRSSSTGSNSAALMLQHTAASDVPVLAAMAAQLFEITRTLNERTLNDIVHALCRLSEQTSQQVAVSPSVQHPIFRNDAFLFPISKLRVVGLSNVHRVMEFWPEVTAHLIEVADHSYGPLRLYAVSCLTTLVHAGLAHPRDPPIQDNPGLQQALLSPLRNLHSCKHSDVRVKQLECTRQVLDTCGPTLEHAWPVVLGVIHDAASTPRLPAEALSQALACVQLVVNDFLSKLPPKCLPLLLRTLASFTHQQGAVNMSLTAIEMMWNVADFVSQHATELAAAVVPRGDSTSTDEDGLPTKTSMTTLWKSLFQALGNACLDSRLEVRRSGCMTLFSALSTHKTNFDTETWTAIAADVLVPLLSEVETRSRQPAPPPNPKEPDTTLLVHHSRDSPEKQWSDTKCLVIEGMGTAVSENFASLCATPAFPDLWDALCNLLIDWAANSQEELCLATARAFASTASAPEQISLSPASVSASQPSAQDVSVYWIKLFDSLVHACHRVEQRAPACKSKTLAALLDAFKPLFRHIHSRLTESQATSMLHVAVKLVSLKHSDTLVFSKMTEVQESALACVLLLPPSADYPHSDPQFVVLCLQTLSRFIGFAVNPPWTSSSRPSFACFVIAVMDALTTQLARFCEETTIVRSGVASTAIKALEPLLKARSAAPSPQLWQSGVRCFVRVVDLALRGLASDSAARQRDTSTGSGGDLIADETWKAIVSVLREAFFLPDSSTIKVEGGEAMDIEVVALVRDTMLPKTAPRSRRGASSAGTDVTVPDQVIQDVRDMLSECSIERHGSATASGSGIIRMELAAACFKALLDGFGEDSATSGVKDSQEDASQSSMSPLDVGGRQGESHAGGSSSLGDHGQKTQWQTESLQRVLDSGISKLEALISKTRGDDASPLSEDDEQEVQVLIRSLAQLIDAQHRQAAARLYPTLVSFVAVDSLAVRSEVQAALTKYQALLLSP